MKEVNVPDRLFSVGDIHDRSTALRTMIDAIAPDPDDTIVVSGDDLDLGTDSRSVVQRLIDLSKRCRLIPILGNHEQMLLRALESESALRSWLDVGGKQTLLSYPYDGTDIIDPAHVEFIRSGRDSFETDGFIFIHAHHDADLSMDRQPSLKLRWEFVQLELQRPHVSGKTLIVGHTPQLSGEVLDLGFLKVIDADCSRGGWLTAPDPRTGEVRQCNQQGESRCTRRKDTARCVTQRGAGLRRRDSFGRDGVKS
jgi:serine/threonine protein phosphatase 1